ncbi:MAG: B-box zinc finger protein [Anaerolineales bacterium]
MTDAISETLYCANHPQTATSLRCNKCGKPICAKCAVLTPVGYRCPECVRTQQQIFETAVWYDYLVAVVVTAPLATLAGLLVTRLGFFVIILAPVVGGVVAEIVRAAVRRRRGRYLSLAAAGAFVLGCLPLIFAPLLIAVLALFAGEGRSVTGGLFIALWPLIYTAIGASTLYARLRGISIR